MEWYRLRIFNWGKNEKTVFYGNDAFYVLFRLHNYLYERLAIVKDCVKKGDDKWRPSQKEGEGKEEGETCSFGCMIIAFATHPHIRPLVRREAPSRRQRGYR